MMGWNQHSTVQLDQTGEYRAMLLGQVEVTQPMIDERRKERISLAHRSHKAVVSGWQENGTLTDVQAIYKEAGVQVKQGTIHVICNGHQVSRHRVTGVSVITAVGGTVGHLVYIGRCQQQQRRLAVVLDLGSEEAADLLIREFMEAKTQSTNLSGSFRETPLTLMQDPPRRHRGSKVQPQATDTEDPSYPRQEEYEEQRQRHPQVRPRPRTPSQHRILPQALPQPLPRPLPQLPTPPPPQPQPQSPLLPQAQPQSPLLPQAQPQPLPRPLPLAKPQSPPLPQPLRRPRPRLSPIQHPNVSGDPHEQRQQQVLATPDVRPSTPPTPGDESPWAYPWCDEEDVYEVVSSDIYDYAVPTSPTSSEGNSSEYYIEDPYENLVSFVRHDNEEEEEEQQRAEPSLLALVCGFLQNEYEYLSVIQRISDARRSLPPELQHLLRGMEPLASVHDDMYVELHDGHRSCSRIAQVFISRLPQLEQYKYHLMNVPKTTHHLEKVPQAVMLTCPKLKEDLTSSWKRLHYYFMTLEKIMESAPAETKGVMQEAIDLLKDLYRQGDAGILIDGVRAAPFDLHLQMPLLLQNSFVVSSNALKKPRGSKYHVLLFAEMIVLTLPKNGKYDFKTHLRTEQLYILSLKSDAGEEFALELRHGGERRAEKYRFRARSSAIKEKWVAEISRLIEKVAERSKCIMKKRYGLD